MASPEISSLASAIKNLDSTLELEIPLEPLDSCNSCLSISLELDGIPLEISKPGPSISGVFGKDSLETGNLDSQDMTGDQVP